MRTLILICLFLITNLFSFAQNQRDTIEVVKGFGTAYVFKGKLMSPRDLLDLTQDNTAVYKELKTAKTNSDIANVLGFAGGFLIGLPLGSALAGAEPNWALAGIGAGLIVISIPFDVAFNKRATKAVRKYNSEIGN
jgi:hypothetical protein